MVSCNCAHPVLSGMIYSYALHAAFFSYEYSFRSFLTLYYVAVVVYYMFFYAAACSYQYYYFGIILTVLSFVLDMSRSALVPQ